MKRRSRNASSKSLPSYELLEPRMLLAGDILVGNLNSGVAISDTATGTGHIMYSEVDVHSRFGGIPASNADHFIATRVDGVQWQFNNDVSWVDFTPVESDLLVAEVNFDADSVMRAEVSGPKLRYRYYFDIPGFVQGVESGFHGEDLRFAPNRFDGAVDEGEIQILGTSFSRNEYYSDHSLSEQRISEVGVAALRYESVTQDFPRAASYASDGSPLLSWRVHLLPFMGLQNLYDQFNLEEPWDSATNLPLASQMPDAYSSPHFSSTTETSFLAVTGSGAMFPEYGPQFSYGQVTDGSHTTVMFVEADADHKVIWTKPGDLGFDPADPLAGLGNIAPEGFAAFTAGNRAYTIPATVDPQNFANMAIRNDGNFVDFSEIGPYTSSVDSLRQLTLSMHDYESAHMRFPSHAIYSDDGTTPLLSWRVQILPFIEHNDLYEQFHLDEPWDSPHNLSLLPLMPQIFAHPNVANGMTNYLAVTGPGTIFEFADQGISFGHLTDGSSNTVMLVEANADQAVEWTRPQDWVPDFADPTAGLGDLVPDGFNVGFGDGSILFVDNDISDVDFGKMLTRSGGEVADFGFVEDSYGIDFKLRQLALATHNYESAHMKFPKHGTYSDGGTPLLSWRVQVLPFIEQNALHAMFHHDEPWDSPHNLSLLPLMPEIYETEGVPNGFTVLQGSNGPNTMFPLQDQGFGFGAITDGTSNTILFMQVDADRAIEWTRPLDLPFDSANPSDGLGGDLESGFHFVAADGATHFYNNALDKAPLEYLLQKSDGVPVAPEYVEDVTLLRRSNEISNDLRQLALAAHNYESAHSRLPPHAIYSPRTSSGTPVLSWRVEILPFIEHGDLYDMFHLDEPWDSPHNLSLLPLMPDVFAHPLVENGKTLFQAVTTPFNNGEPESMFPIHYRNSSLGAIQDGSSNTIMFVESNVDQAVEWTKPQDIMFDPNDPTFGLGEAFLGLGYHVAMGDGSTHFIENCISPETTANLILKNDGNVTNGADHDCEAGIAAKVAKSGVSYDGGTPAPDKAALLPGQTATFENYTSFVNGITSLSVDIGRLSSPFSIGADDFVLRVGNGNENSDFTELAIVPTVSVAIRAGASESDRVTLEFPAGSITNTWLQVTVLANDATGLAADHTFYFGNVIGETGNDPNNAIVNLIDLALARENQTGFGTADIDNHYDIDRDGRVNLIDVALIRENQSGFSSVNLITAPDGSAGRGIGGGGSKGGGSGGLSFLDGGGLGFQADVSRDEAMNLDLELGKWTGRDLNGLKDELQDEPKGTKGFAEKLRLSGAMEMQQVANTVLDLTFSDLSLNQVEESIQVFEAAKLESKLVAAVIDVRSRG